MIALEFCLALIGALITGTLAEYFIHRLMHWGVLYPKGHLDHHLENDPRTFLADFIDYGSGALLLSWIGFLVSVPAGIGWAAGAFLYAALASYSHQLQHAHADMVFWMPRPVHRLHHDLDSRDKNFGVLVDWWDRLFGTYQPIERPRRSAAEGRNLRDFVAIPWR